MMCLPAATSASIWASRIFEGPLPNRPSEGRRSAGINIFTGVELDIPSVSLVLPAIVQSFTKN
jgi:hypothetical protein